MRCCRFVALVPLLLALGCADDSKQYEVEIELKPIKAKDWPAALKTHEGKIIAVDVWADFCLPCKEHFHKQVALHKKHAWDGVQCISVCVDPIESKEKSLAFLKKSNATFPNYLVDGETKDWQDLFDINGPPLYLVFDRSGKEVGRFQPGNPKRVGSHED